MAAPLLELRDRQCRYPLERDAEGVRLFCAAPTPEGKSYCDHHYAVAVERVIRAPGRQEVRWLGHLDEAA